MKFFKKLKSSNFWVSMISAVILILQAVFNVDIKTEYLNQIILGILGILVMTGIVSDTPNNEVTISQGFDFDKMKDSITSMLAQVSATLQTDMTNIMSQFEKVNSTQVQSSVETKQEDIGAIQETIKQVDGQVQQLEIETNDIVEPVETAMQDVNAPKNEL